MKYMPYLSLLIMPLYITYMLYKRKNGSGRNNLTYLVVKHKRSNETINKQSKIGG